MQKVKWVFVIAATVIISSSFMVKAPVKEKINWLTLTELQEAYKKQPRPILFDIYTDWCGWCKVMDRDTYQKDNVAEYINKQYYAVKFNAESKDSVTLGNKKYGYNPAYKSNDLAVYLLFGQMSYPTTVFMPAIDAQPAPLAGFLKPSELEAPLKFFGDGAFQKQNFTEYLKTFTSTW
jgi:uncharacterized protein YyaL (SSP411 family)